MKLHRTAPAIRLLAAAVLIAAVVLPAIAFAQMPPAAPEILLKLPRDLSP